MCQGRPLFLSPFSPSVLPLSQSPARGHSRLKDAVTSSPSPVSKITFGANSVRVCAQIGHVVTSLLSQLLYMKPSCTAGPSDGIAPSPVGPFKCPCSRYGSLPFERFLINCCNNLFQVPVVSFCNFRILYLCKSFELKAPGSAGLGTGRQPDQSVVHQHCLSFTGQW